MQYEIETDVQQRPDRKPLNPVWLGLLWLWIPFWGLFALMTAMAVNACPPVDVDPGCSGRVTWSWLALMVTQLVIVVAALSATIALGRVNRSGKAILVIIAAVVASPLSILIAVTAMRLP